MFAPALTGDGVALSTRPDNDKSSLKSGTETVVYTLDVLPSAVFTPTRSAYRPGFAGSWSGPRSC